MAQPLFRIVRQVQTTARTHSGDAFWDSTHIDHIPDANGDYVEKLYPEWPGTNGASSIRHVRDCNPAAVAKLRERQAAGETAAPEWVRWDAGRVRFCA